MNKNPRTFRSGSMSKLTHTTLLLSFVAPTLAIVLTLLHPLQAVPVQSWTFDTNTPIRIGRSTNNDVVLYSAVVSRHHVEIAPRESGWELVNLGANGTYIDGKRVTKMSIVDGTLMRLASSGPQIQIRIESGQSTQKIEQTSRQRSSEPLGGDNTKDTLIT
jgi:pSer/pThr/pTyr-binding forkhead associated (FHA) protein